MTYFFTDENANYQATSIAANPATPELGKAGALQGAFSAPFVGAYRGVGQMGLAAYDVVAEPTGYVVRGGEEQDPDAYMERRRNEYSAHLQSTKPDAMTTGAVGQALDGIANVGVQFLLGSLATGNPFAGAAVAGGVQAHDEYETQKTKVDKETAVRMAAIQGAATALGGAIPASFGTTLLTKSITGAAMNAPIGMVQRYGSGEVLKAGGYNEMAESYQAFDKMAIASDIVLGAIIPGAAHVGGKIGNRVFNRGNPDITPKPSEVDSATYAARIINEQRDSQIGLHKTPESAMAHTRMMDEIEHQLLVEGRDPSQISVGDYPRAFDFEVDTTRFDSAFEVQKTIQDDAPKIVLDESAHAVKTELEPAKIEPVQAEPIIEFPKPEVQAEGKVEVKPTPDGEITSMYEKVQAGDKSDRNPITQIGEQLYRRGAFKEESEFKSFVKDMEAIRDKGLTGKAYLDELKSVIAKNEPKIVEDSPTYYADDAAMARQGDVPTIEEQSARQVLLDNPDMMIPHGDGTVSARDLLKQLDSDIETSKIDAKLHYVAAACAITNGE